MRVFDSKHAFLGGLTQHRVNTSLAFAKLDEIGQAIIAGRETPILTPRIHESREIGKDLLAAINTLARQVEKSLSVLKRDADLRARAEEELAGILDLFGGE